MKFTFKTLNESAGPITFENLENYSNELWTTNRTTKLFELIGKFVGFDGVEYVALRRWSNLFPDKSYLTFKNFIKSYYIYEEPSSEEPKE